jgi:hypothetical protein
MRSGSSRGHNIAISARLAFLRASFLVIRIGRGDDQLLGSCVKNRLLRVVGAIGEAGHPHP